LDEATVARRLEALRETVSGGSSHGPVTICAVTKGFPAEVIRLAARLGCEAIGENYAQEALAKIAEVGGGHPPLHFIGRLQGNKIKQLAGIVAVWQSIDRVSLVDELTRRAPGARIFVQVNATQEADKGGASVTDTPVLVATARRQGLDVAGLMTVGPTDGDPEGTRRAFRTVRRLADELGLPGCSMGMSGDLDIALAEGTTMVRIGSALFGERP
jgi:pyridoxal phosphate enzyme (YggS family)